MSRDTYRPYEFTVDHQDAGSGTKPENTRYNPHEIVSVPFCRLFWRLDYNRHTGIPENCIWQTPSNMQTIKSVAQTVTITNLIPGLKYRAEVTGYERYRPWEPILKKANFRPRTIAETPLFATHGTLGTNM